MKRLFFLLAMAALTTAPAWAGVSVSIHVGGGYGGYRGGGYHGYSAGCYGGYHGYSGGYGYPGYGVVSYGYGPSFISYGAPIDYGYAADTYPSAYIAEAPAAPAPPAPAPAPAGSAPSLPLGKVDEFGYVHSPFTTATFKVDTFANGQTFYDPITGQAFTVHKANAAPKAPASTGLMPPGKIDEFGYVHSPYSTYTVRAKSDPSAQVYQDPNTGQFFTAVPKAASVHVASAQVVD